MMQMKALVNLLIKQNQTILCRTNEEALKKDSSPKETVVSSGKSIEAKPTGILVNENEANL